VSCQPLTVVRHQRSPMGYHLKEGGFSSNAAVFARIITDLLPDRSPWFTRRGPSLHSVTNHLTRSAIAFFRPSQRNGLPGVRTLSPPRSGLRHSLADRRYARPDRVRHPTDYRFASGCSPPRLTATQLPSTTRGGHPLKEDFHLLDRACSQAH